MWSVEREPYGAIHRMGTNAIPTLLRWLTEDDPPEPEKPNRAPCYTLVRSERAVWGFRILGETAQPAIPELTRLARTTPDPKLADRCIRALACIGPASLPAFIEIMTNGTYRAKFSAVEELSSVSFDYTPAMSALIECLTGEKERLAFRAGRTLCLSSIDEDTLVPALTNALQTASPSARAEIFACLRSLDVPARAAVPAIRTGLSDPDDAVRTNAFYAAERIAPELLIPAKSP
jgi:HEAT repeat protein